jgi:hypothetical protein
MNKTINCLLLGIILLPVPLMADNLNSATKATVKNHQRSEQSQAHINSLSSETQNTTDEYISNERQADLAQAYNDQISNMIHSQEKEIATLKSQILSIDEIDKAVLPMLNAMTEKMALFVENDTPFLPQERKQRVQRLKNTLQRADVSVAEKYRQILEAYKVEVDYGRSLEAYRGELLGQPKPREVTFLRLGRTALYYQTINGLSSALWLNKSQQWQVLNKKQNRSLSKAIKIAQKQSIPKLLSLPMPPLEN